MNVLAKKDGGGLRAAALAAARFAAGSYPTTTHALLMTGIDGIEHLCLLPVGIVQIQMFRGEVRQPRGGSIPINLSVQERRQEQQRLQKDGQQFVVRPALHDG